MNLKQIAAIAADRKKGRVEFSNIPGSDDIEASPGPVEKYPSKASPETIQILDMFLSPVLASKKWHPPIEESEKDMLFQAWGVALDYYFPDGLNIHPLFGAAVATAAVFGPRMKGKGGNRSTSVTDYPDEISSNDKGKANESAPSKFEP